MNATYIFLFLLLIFALPSSQADNASKIKWDEDGHYYEIIHSTLNWDEARAYAESQQFAENDTGIVYFGHLAIITSLEENSWVLQNIISPLNAQNYSIWLGGYQETGYEGRPLEGWNWTTGEPWAWSNWNPGEPNDANGGERHLEMWGLFLPRCEDPGCRLMGMWNDEMFAGLAGVTEYILIEYEPMTGIASRYTLNFEGVGFNKEGELIISINGENLENIPLSSNNQWMSYSLDITDLIEEDNTRNVVRIYDSMENSNEQIRGISIIKDEHFIHKYIPNMGVKIGLIEFDFNPALEPVASAYAGPVTIEMYAPEELTKGEQNSIKIEVKSLRMHSLDDCQKSITDTKKCNIQEMPVYSGITKGDIRICYSEKIDMGPNPVILLRHVDEDWSKFAQFVPDDPCTPVQGFIGGVILGLIGELPGIGFAMSVNDGVSSCESPYSTSGPYSSEPPQSIAWRNINEYDVFDLAYIVKYPHTLADKIEAIYPLTFNEPGEYEITAFVDCYLEEDHGIGPVPLCRIGKELSTRINVE